MRPGPTGRVLTVNAGSSSIKVDVFDLGPGQPVRRASGEVGGIGSSEPTLAWTGGDRSDERSMAGGADHGAALDALLTCAGEDDGGPIVGVGHRIAHGGLHHVQSEVADPAILRDLDSLVPLAPLHLPHNIAAVRIVSGAVAVPQVLCYDTAFHAGMPDEARHFPLPRALTEAGVVRFGFHGLSYEHVVRRLPELLEAPRRERVVAAHLGAGASLCAIRHGRSVATTMGFTPLDGIPMATRSGAIDPGVVLFLLREGRTVDEVDDLLNHRSGLAGLSGISGDVRDLVGSAEPAAAAALATFAYRIRESVGALTADLGGLDALVFTGGIGEHQPPVRAAVCEGLDWLGVTLDAGANRRGGPRLDRPESRVAVVVMEADEAMTIACHTEQVLSVRGR